MKKHALNTLSNWAARGKFRAAVHDIQTASDLLQSEADTTTDYRFQEQLLNDIGLAVVKAKDALRKNLTDAERKEYS